MRNVFAGRSSVMSVAPLPASAVQEPATGMIISGRSRVFSPTMLSLWRVMVWTSRSPFMPCNWMLTGC